MRARTVSSRPATSSGSAPNIRPVLTFGQDDVELERGDLVALAHPFDQFGDLVVRATHDVDDQRAGRSASLGRSSRRKLPTLCSADRSSPQAARSSNEPRRRVSLARAIVTVLVTKAATEALEQRVAERALGGDGVERAGRVDDGVLEVQERSWMVHVSQD